MPLLDFLNELRFEELIHRVELWKVQGVVVCFSMKFLKPLFIEFQTGFFTYKFPPPNFILNMIWLRRTLEDLKVVLGQDFIFILLAIELDLIQILKHLINRLDGSLTTIILGWILADVVNEFYK